MKAGWKQVRSSSSCPLPTSTSWLLHRLRPSRTTACHTVLSPWLQAPLQPSFLGVTTHCYVSMSPSTLLLHPLPCYHCFKWSPHTVTNVFLALHQKAPYACCEDPLLQGHHYDQLSPLELLLQHSPHWSRPNATYYIK